MRNEMLSDKKEFILRLLVETPREWYGLEMVEASKGLLFRGTIYWTLGRMEEDGLIESRRDDSTLGRRLYKATPLGEQRFAENNNKPL